MKKNIIILILTSLMSMTLFSQGSLRINGVTATRYPTIKIEFTAKDAADKQLKDADINDNDVTVLENGKIKFGTVECPPTSQSKFSTILIIDRSPSMKQTIEPGISKYDAAKSAARLWVDELPTNRFECAIVSFSTKCYLVNDFTTEKGELIKGINGDLLEPEKQSAGTDYNAAFLYDLDLQEGGLKIAERAKYPIYVIFLTDGEHQAGGDRGSVWIDKILEKKNQLNATVYSVILGDVNPLFVERDVLPLSDLMYVNIKSQALLKKTYQDLISKVSMIPIPPPCVFTYESECNGGGNISLFLKNSIVDASASTNFVIPAELKPYLEFDPTLLNAFINVPPGTKATTNVKLTARQNNIFLTNPIISDSKFKILNWTPNITLYKNNSIDLTIEYTAPLKDSSYFPCTIDFDGTACGNRITLPSAGWLYAMPVDIGNSPIDKKKTKQFDAVFCNKSGSEIDLQKIEIFGGDNTNFTVDGYGGVTKLANNQCVNITFSFTPNAHRSFSSNYRVVTSKGAFTETIIGSGSGTPEILTIDSLAMDTHVDCKVTQAVKTFKVFNPGALPLEISSSRITPSGEFSVSPASKTTIQPEDSLDFTVTFSPYSAGLILADLVIYSNAANKNEYHIQLSGTKDSIFYDPDKKTLDFGVLCPGQDSTIMIGITVPGLTVNDNVTVSTSGDLAPANVMNVSNIQLVPGNKANLTVNVSATQKKAYNGTLSLKDDLCGITYNIPVTWKVDEPGLADLTLLFTANVPEKDTQNVIITNNSQRAYSIGQSTFRDAEFYFLNPVNYPVNLPANGGTASFDIVYEPSKEGTINSWLVFEGTPCSYTDSVRLTGSATASGASLEIDEHESCLGETIEVPVFLRKCSKFSNSGVSKISFSVAYDPSLLEPVELLPNQTVSSPKTTLTAQTVAKQDNDQLIATLKFRSLDGSASVLSALSLTEIKNEDGAVALTNKDGVFRSIPSSAKIIIGNVTAYPGEAFSLPVKLDSVDICSASFHKNMIIKVRFNKTLIDQIKGSPQCTIDNDYRIADLVIPLSNNVITGYIANFKFGSMLGNQQSTPIELVSAEYELGVLDYTYVNGSFSLNICNQGGQRLFDPAGGFAAGIYSIDPSPAGERCSARVNTIEDGNNVLILSDVFGNNTVLQSFENKGFTEFDLNLSQFSAGVYFVILKTPTEIFSYKFLIVK